MWCFSYITRKLYSERGHLDRNAGVHAGRDARAPRGRVALLLYKIEILERSRNESCFAKIARGSRCG